MAAVLRQAPRFTLDNCIDHAIGLAALEIRGHGDVHETEQTLPKVAEVIIVPDDVALMLDADAASAAQHRGHSLRCSSNRCRTVSRFPIVLG